MKQRSGICCVMSPSQEERAEWISILRLIHICLLSWSHRNPELTNTSHLMMKILFKITVHVELSLPAHCAALVLYTAVLWFDSWVLLYM